MSTRLYTQIVENKRLWKAGQYMRITRTISSLSKKCVRQVLAKKGKLKKGGLQGTDDGKESVQSWPVYEIEKNYITFQHTHILKG